MDDDSKRNHIMSVWMWQELLWFSEMQMQMQKKKKQDSDVLNCVNEVVDVQTSIKAIFALRRVFCWFWAYGFYLFQKVNKICNRLIYNMAMVGKTYFTRWGAPKGCLVFVDFKHMVLTFSWKYNTFAIDWFFIFLPQGPVHNCSLIVSLTFFNCLCVRNMSAKFHGFISFHNCCTNGPDYFEY